MQLSKTEQYGSVCLILGLLCSSQTRAVEPPITSLAFAPDGKSVVATSQAGLFVYNWPELKRQRTIETSAANLHCLAFSPTGKQLAVGGGNPAQDGSVEVFSWPAGKSERVLREHKDSVRAIAWRDASSLLSASVDRQIKLWDVQKAKSLATYQGHSRGVSSLCLLNEGQTLVSAGDDQSIRVWDMKTGKNVRSLSQHTAPVHALEVRPGEGGLPMVASAADDRTIRFWQPTIGRMVRYVRLDAKPLDLAWSNDGSRIVAACIDGRIRVVDVDEVKVTQTLPVLEGWVYAIARHPKDNSVVVGGSNGQVRWVTPNRADP